VKLRDFGLLGYEGQPRLDQWLQQIFEWSRKKITFEDNLDLIFQSVYIGTGETQVQHNLGRVPKGIIEVAAYPNGTAGISHTKAPTNEFLYLSRVSAGQCQLMIF